MHSIWKKTINGVETFEVGFYADDYEFPLFRTTDIETAVRLVSCLNGGDCKHLREAIDNSERIPHPI